MALVSITKEEYVAARQALLADNGQKIIDLEKRTCEKLTEALLSRALQIARDFNHAVPLQQFWLKYAPRQRGHKPRGDSLPWGEVGEKTIEGHLYGSLGTVFPEVCFTGLPYGHDVRCTTDNAFLHIDVKSTGPNDNPNEVVCSPNQVTGDGIDLMDDGVHNNLVTVVGPSRNMVFQPELPPFYILEKRIRVCITFYIKVLYSVNALGDQPLNYIELICVPNGLLMFDGPYYARNIQGLMTPGKDIVTSVHKRTRIKLDPLAKAFPWRCQKILVEGDSITIKPRYSSTSQT